MVEQFNTELFIDLVKNRPPIYLRSLKEYSDPDLKRLLWEEICSELFPNWNELTSQNKNRQRREVQKKWLNLRSCFSRELKTQRERKAGKNSIKRRKYIYFKNLYFLLPSMQQQYNESEVDFPEIDESENQGSMESSPPSTFTSIYPSTSKIPFERDGEVKNENLVKPVRNIVDEEIDEDRNFALSLIPSLRSLTEIEKYQAKIDILNIFKDIKLNRIPDSQ